MSLQAVNVRRSCPAPVCSTEAIRFYRHVMMALNAADVPFLLGGTFALCHFSKIVRPTKDMDLFIRHTDLERACDVLQAKGFATDVPFPHWLAKAYDRDLFIDIIFNSGNGVAAVDDAWFTFAEPALALDVPVLIAPAEESIWSKAFIMERERFDGADVAHFIRACRGNLDWRRLLKRFDSYWRVLMSHVVLFDFIYPGEHDAIPTWVRRQLINKLQEAETTASEDVCNGTLLSREQYLVDVNQWGYKDGRVADGHMSEDDVQHWTEAIKTS